MKTPNPWSVDEVGARKRAQRVATAPLLYRKILERSWSPRCSPRAAIKAFCLECVGYERRAVTECEAVACPLWGFRPYVGKGGEGE